MGIITSVIFITIYSICFYLIGRVHGHDRGVREATADMDRYWSRRLRESRQRPSLTYDI